MVNISLNLILDPLLRHFVNLSCLLLVLLPLSVHHNRHCDAIIVKTFTLEVIRPAHLLSRQ